MGQGRAMVGHVIDIILSVGVIISLYIFAYFAIYTADFLSERREDPANPPKNTNASG
jgi:hypothetical protein